MGILACIRILGSGFDGLISLTLKLLAISLVLDGSMSCMESVLYIITEGLSGGGWLTMLMGLALYWVLLASSEMRFAPFLYLDNLAAPDALFGTYFGVPIGLMPILMAVTMFIQTKLNPTPPDPVQAKLMMIMPIVFSVMFFFFPSGLVLYWLVNNMYSIAQQWVITRRIEAQSAKERRS